MDAHADDSPAICTEPLECRVPLACRDRPAREQMGPAIAPAAAGRTPAQWRPPARRRGRVAEDAHADAAGAGGHGLITRLDHHEVPPRVEYSLTPLGSSLAKAIAGLDDWVIRHYDEIERATRRSR